MRFSRKKGVLAFGGTAVVLAMVSCDAKKDETKEEGAAAGVDKIDDVSDLKLSSLNLSLPTYLTDSSAGLSLTSGKRSRESCQAGEVIKQSVERLGEIASFSCHLEVESANMKPGVKYKIVFAGNEFGRVYMDDSEKASGKITMAMCNAGEGDGGSNRQLIEITGVSESGPKGKIRHLGSFEQEGQEGSYAESLEFDLTVAGTQSISQQMRHSMGDNTFVGEALLKMVETGVSELSLARAGTWGGSEFAQKAKGKFDGTYGSILMANSGTFGENTFSFARRAHFDADGLAVDVSVSTDFAVDGALYVAASEVPEYLADDFTPSAPDGWVGDSCPDFDEVLELNPNSAGHEACNIEHSDNEGDGCWDEDTYEEGTDDSVE